jgi:hypothetical protein
MKPAHKTLLWSLIILVMIFPITWTAGKVALCGGLRWVLIFAALTTLWGVVMGCGLRAGK